MTTPIPKKILLTGVSRGLGRALSDAFTAQGHPVAGCARSATAIKHMQSEFPAKCDFTAVDLTSDVDTGEWINALVKRWGTPDLVINNAAIINENMPLWEVPYSDFADLINININGVFSVIRHVMPHLIKQQHGVIANLSSGWGRSVSADVASYCTSKWAIEGMTKALAEDVPPGIAAVPVNPGVINTDMLQSCFGNSADDAQTAEQWAEAAAPFFLSLNENDNGKSLSV
ncbi:MAG: SDR family NAD(P)-dependent oxidoreductase [Granulosicoccaceae bacterium]